MNETHLIEPVRAFMAAPLDASVSAELREIQRVLIKRMAAESVRWVRPDQIHLTLKFLGNVMPDQIELLKLDVRPICMESPALQLRVDKLGCFPDFKYPKVVWVGLAGDLKPLRQLQARLLAVTTAYGDHQEDRPFAPHLTIGRVKVTQAKDVQRVGERIQAAGVSPSNAWTVREIHLIQSRLSPQGPSYTTLDCFKLA